MEKGYVFLLVVLSLLVSALPGWAGGPPAGAQGDTAFVRQAHRRITFQVDQRYSLVDTRIAGINGLKLGMEWRGRYRAGAGLYLLSPGVRAATTADETPVGTQAELRFRYVALFGE